MNDAPEALDQLLREWAASRTADQQHTDRLTSQILAAARDQPDVGRSKSSQFRQEPNSVTLPERRQALFLRTADWGGPLMIGGGVLLLLLVLGGSLLYLNLSTVPSDNSRPLRPIASSGSIPPTKTDANNPPAAASLSATVLAAKRQLLAETNTLFDDQLAWIADGQREFAFEVRDQAARDKGEFMLVRVVVAQRTSPDLPWSTVWHTDVISRSEALVEVAPKQLDGSSLALWTYLMSDGAVAVDMDLTVDQQTRVQSSSSTVLQVGQPTRVDGSTANGIEQCVFQTVMPLNSSRI